MHPRNHSAVSTTGQPTEDISADQEAGVSRPPSSRSRLRYRAVMVVLAAAAAVALMSACQPEARNTGTTVASNPVSNPQYAGQCTWGAEEMWFRATGNYLAVAGDAWNWAQSAAGFGWTVSPTPQARSIVVFDRGVAGAHFDTGHVAWVTNVSHRSDGTYIDLIEMNWTYGPNTWDTRTIKAVPGMSYILAP